MAKVSEIFKKEELTEEESKVTFPLVLISTSPYVPYPYLSVPFADPSPSLYPTLT